METTTPTSAPVSNVLTFQPPAYASIPKRKRTKRTKPAKRAGLDCEIEDLKQILLDQTAGQTAVLTACYMNWFNAQIDETARMQKAMDAPDEASIQKAIDADRRAWEHARALFAQLAPLALHKLADQIADQIENDFAFAPVTAADVSAQIRGLTFFDLLQNAL